MIVTMAKTDVKASEERIELDGCAGQSRRNNSGNQF